MENSLFNPLARRSDPATSKLAGQEIKPKLNDLQQRFVWAVETLGSATASEAAVKCVRGYGGNSESYRKRAGECYRGGYLTIDGTRRCCVTGKQATVYRAAAQVEQVPNTRNALGMR